MTLAQELAAMIPHLRRFARALTGSQASGDAYVAAVLEAIAADPKSLPSASSRTVALYAMFYRIWSTVPVNGKAEPATASWEANADQRLAAILPTQRVAFLLRVLEGFPVADIAQIMGVDEAEANQLIDQANADIAGQIATRVLIIEDEPLTALDIETLVTGLGHEVIANARTHKEAIEAIRRERPGLVLADIHLADGSSGIDAVNDILEQSSPPVIFITAYPERLLTGERPEPTFLISKPYDPAAVRAMISQVMFFETAATSKKVA